MLQEEDPEGEGYLRCPGGIPYMAEMKPGYWDGPYSYIDEEGNHVTTSQGYKVDLYFMDVDDFVSEHFNLHDPNNWEKIRSKIKCDFDNYSNESNRKEREECLIKSFRRAWEEEYRLRKSFFDRTLEKMVENAKKGWSWFQNREVDNPDPQKALMHHYYTWKVYDENGNEQLSTPHNTESPYKSGLWERADNGAKPGYYQWIYKNNN